MFCVVGGCSLGGVPFFSFLGSWVKGGPPMPSLPKPRLRRGTRGELISPPEPQEREPNVQSVSANGFRWLNIERPTPLETAWLEEHFDFHALDFEDVLSRNQRPKIDEYPDYLFIV